MKYDDLISIEKKDVQNYIDNLVKKTYTVLGIFEDCMRNNDYKDYYNYLDRLIIEITGVKSLFDIVDFISIIGILNGLKEYNNIKHKNVRSIVFHCISVLKKIKVI